MKSILVSILLLPAVAAGQLPDSIPILSASFAESPTRLATMGEAVGVAVKGNEFLYVLTRGSVIAQGKIFGNAQVLEYTNDRTNGYVFTRELVPGLYAWSSPHSIRLDHEGNLWVVDAGSNMLVKFDRTGLVKLVLGRRTPFVRAIPGRSRSVTDTIGIFGGPTDVAFDSHGNIYVTDGFVHSRLVKLDKDGRWLKSVGALTGAPPAGNGTFNLPHAIAIDVTDTLYVVDSNNDRIQVFDSDLKFIRSIAVKHQPSEKMPLMSDGSATGEPKTSAPWSICIPPTNTGVMFVSDANPGRIYKMKRSTGEVLGTIGRSGKSPKEFGWIHGIGCESDTWLVVAELLNWRVQSLTLSPTSRPRQ